MLFLGVHGISVDAGFSTPNLLEGETDQAHLASAERVVVVADHTKWGVRGLEPDRSARGGARARHGPGPDRPRLVASSRSTSISSSLRPCTALDPGRTARPEPRSRDVRAPEVEERDPGKAQLAPSSRTDDVTGAQTYIVASRQTRPNLPEATCPFCPGGLEAPEQYDVRWFPNRWPAMPDGRCEVILYTPDHDATFWSLGPGRGAQGRRPLGRAKRAPRRPRGHLLRARVREPRRGGGRHDHPSAWADLRIRLRPGGATSRTRARHGRSTIPASGS